MHTISIFSATVLEIKPLLQALGMAERLQRVGQHIRVHLSTGNTLHVVLTGAGSSIAAYNIGTFLATHNTDAAIQVGVAGSYRYQWPLQSVVHVIAEKWANLGAETADGFVPYNELPFFCATEFPFTATGHLINPLQTSDIAILQAAAALPSARAITVDAVAGRQSTVNRRIATYQADIESMEGAAMHYACLQKGIAFAQVRAISNYVEVRQEQNWQLAEAVIALNKWLMQKLYIQPLAK